MSLLMEHENSMIDLRLTGILKRLGVSHTVSLMPDKIEDSMEGKIEYLWFVIWREFETTMLQVLLHIGYWRIGLNIVRFVEEQSDLSCSLYWTKMENFWLCDKSIEIQVHVPD